MEKQKCQCLLKQAAKQQLNVESHRCQANLNTPAINDKWSPGLVTGREDIVRNTWLRHRATQIKRLQVTEILYDNFYRSGILSKMDKTMYAEYYCKLLQGLDIVQKPHI